MKKLPFALAAAALIAGPTFAGELPARVETVKLKVSTQGLNLADPRDAAQLQVRIDKAIASACTPGGVYQAFQVLDNECSVKMANDSQQIVARMTNEATKSRMAEF